MSARANGRQTNGIGRLVPRVLYQKARLAHICHQMRMFAQQDSSVFDTIHHNKHRVRREVWSPYFSKQSVSRLQPTLIQAKIDELCERLAEHQAQVKPVVMIYAFATLTVDVISEYSYPEGYNYLRKPEFDRENYDAFMSLSGLSHFIKQFPLCIPVFNATPPWLLKIINPDAYTAFAIRNVSCTNSLVPRTMHLDPWS